MTPTYSSTEWPLTLTMTGVVGAFSASHARSLATNASTPGFCSPIELSMPLAVSAIRGLALPGHGPSDTPLVTTAPSRERSTKSANSRPEAKVPDAVTTGLRSSSEPRRTLMSTFRLTSAHPL